MLKLLDWLLLPREMRELARLNEIYEAFNEKRITGEETRHLIYSHQWKYHHDKIDILFMFIELYGTGTTPQYT